MDNCTSFWVILVWGHVSDDHRITEQIIILLPSPFCLLSLSFSFFSWKRRSGAINFVYMYNRIKICPQTRCSAEPEQFVHFWGSSGRTIWRPRQHCVACLLEYDRHYFSLLWGWWMCSSLERYNFFLFICLYLYWFIYCFLTQIFWQPKKTVH